MHAGKLNHEYSNGYAKRQNIMTWGAFLTMEIGYPLLMAKQRWKVLLHKISCCKRNIAIMMTRGLFMTGVQNKININNGIARFVNNQNFPVNAFWIVFEIKLVNFGGQSYNMYITFNRQSTFKSPFLQIKSL